VIPGWKMVEPETLELLVILLFIAVACREHIYINFHLANCISVKCQCNH
jgi:hypothetical protein